MERLLWVETQKKLPRLKKEDEYKLYWPIERAVRKTREKISLLKPKHVKRKTL